MVRNLNINDKTPQTWNRTGLSLKYLTISMWRVHMSHHRCSSRWCTVLWVVQNSDSYIPVSTLACRMNKFQWFKTQSKVVWQHCGTHEIQTSHKSQQLIRLYLGVESGEQEAFLYHRWPWSESCAFNNKWQVPVISETHLVSSSVTTWLRWKEFCRQDWLGSLQYPELSRWGHVTYAQNAAKGSCECRQG